MTLAVGSDQHSQQRSWPPLTGMHGFLTWFVCVLCLQREGWHCLVSAAVLLPCTATSSCAPEQETYCTSTRYNSSQPLFNEVFALPGESLVPSLAGWEVGV